MMGLPQARPYGHLLSEASPATPSPGPAPRRGAILLVEDSDDVRQGLAQLLELHGFLVADASTGAAALRQLADPALAAIPTIVVTVCEVDHVQRTALRPEAWIEKPYRFDELLGLVRRYVVSEGSALQVDQ